jgi:hypothetical protein
LLNFSEETEHYCREILTDDSSDTASMKRYNPQRPELLENRKTIALFDAGALPTSLKLKHQMVGAAAVPDCRSR